MFVRLKPGPFLFSVGGQHCESTGMLDTQEQLQDVL